MYGAWQAMEVSKEGSSRFLEFKVTDPFACFLHCPESRVVFCFSNMDLSCNHSAIEPAPFQESEKVFSQHVQSCNSRRRLHLPTPFGRATGVRN